MGNLGWSGSTLTANMTGTGRTVPVNTVRWVSWAPFAYQDGAGPPRPSTTDMETTLAQLYPPVLFGPDGDAPTGRALAVQIMYEVLYQGLMTLVGVGDLQLELPGAMSKGEVSQAMASILNSANSLTKNVIDLFARLSAAKNPAEFFSAIAEAWEWGSRQVVQQSGHDGRHHCHDQPRGNAGYVHRGTVLPRRGTGSIRTWGSG